MIYVTVSCSLLNVLLMFYWSFQIGGVLALALAASAMASMISLLMLNNHIMRKR